MAPAASTKKDDVDMDTLKQDFEQLRENFQTLRGHLGKVGESRLSEAGAKGREHIDEIETMMKSLAQDLRVRGELGVAKVEDTIRERPMTSLLAAFGIGMLISMLLTGRRH